MELVWGFQILLEQSQLSPWIPRFGANLCGSPGSRTKARCLHYSQLEDATFWSCANYENNLPPKIGIQRDDELSVCYPTNSPLRRRRCYFHPSSIFPLSIRKPIPSSLNISLSSYLSIYLSIHLSIYLSIHPSIYLSVSFPFSIHTPSASPHGPAPHYHTSGTFGLELFCLVWFAYILLDLTRLRK